MSKRPRFDSSVDPRQTDSFEPFLSDDSDNDLSYENNTTTDSVSSEETAISNECGPHLILGDFDCDVIFDMFNDTMENLSENLSDKPEFESTCRNSHLVTVKSLFTDLLTGNVVLIQKSPSLQWLRDGVWETLQSLEALPGQPERLTLYGDIFKTRESGEQLGINAIGWKIPSPWTKPKAASQTLAPSLNSSPVPFVWRRQLLDYFKKTNFSHLANKFCLPTNNKIVKEFTSAPISLDKGICVDLGDFLYQLMRSVSNHVANLDSKFGAEELAKSLGEVAYKNATSASNEPYFFSVSVNDSRPLECSSQETVLCVLQKWDSCVNIENIENYIVVCKSTTACTELGFDAHISRHLVGVTGQVLLQCFPKISGAAIEISGTSNLDEPAADTSVSAVDCSDCGIDVEASEVSTDCSSDLIDSVNVEDADGFVNVEDTDGFVDVGDTDSFVDIKDASIVHTADKDAYPAATAQVPVFWTSTEKQCDIEECEFPDTCDLADKNAFKLLQELSASKRTTKSYLLSILADCHENVLVRKDPNISFEFKGEGGDMTDCETCSERSLQLIEKKREVYLATEVCYREILAQVPSTSLKPKTPANTYNITSRNFLAANRILTGLRNDGVTPDRRTTVGKALLAGMTCTAGLNDKTAIPNTNLSALYGPVIGHVIHKGVQHEVFVGPRGGKFIMDSKFGKRFLSGLGRSTQSTFYK